MEKEILNKCSNIVEIYEGGQRKTYKANHCDFGEIALKIGKYCSLISLERIKREVEFLRNISSAYFPKNHDFIIDEKNETFYIIEEYIPSKPLTELKSYFDSEDKILKLFLELINGLKNMWKLKIVHRDLKPDNILITSNYEPKIIDIGIARFLDLDSLTKSIFFSGPCTPIYASPEQLLNKKRIIDIRSDFFCLGIILLELHLGFHPFSPDKLNNKNSIPENIIQGKYIKPEYKPNTTLFFSNLINKLLQLEPYNRFKNYNILQDFFR